MYLDFRNRTETTQTIIVLFFGTIIKYLLAQIGSIVLRFICEYKIQ